MANQSRQIFMGSSIFKVPAGTTRARVIAEATGFSRFVCDKSASYLLDGSGQLWSWGLNANGQLGQGNVTPCSSPIAVTQGTTKFVNVWVPPTNTYPQTFALDTNGQLWSWGLNGSFPPGLLGQGQSAGAFANSSPILVAGSGIGFGKTQYANLFTGAGQIFALDINANLWAWGSNFSGSAGTGAATPTAYSSPTMVVGGIKWQSVDCLGGTPIGLDVNGNAWCWGSHAGGATGVGLNTGSTSSPIQVIGSHKFKKVMAAMININTGIGIPGPCNFGVDLQGNVWTWGNNTYGQAGVAAPWSAAYSSPVLVTFPAGIQIQDLRWNFNGSTDEGTFYALDQNGQIWAWGQTGLPNGTGSLGTGPLGLSTGLSTPTLVVGGHNFVNIWTRPNGLMWGWGNNGNGVLGNNNGTLNASTPVAVSGAHQLMWMDFDSANTGPVFGCDLYGQLWSWSWNNFGAAGNGTGVFSITQSSPLQVLGTKVVSMQNPQNDLFFDVVPGTSIPVIFGGLYTQFARQFVGPIPLGAIPQSTVAGSTSPLTLIANKITVEYDQ
jgi:alpha-tubulin suppressor-like RCC1 family protein